MNTEYESLNLDGLLELSRSDAEHAGDMAEQARVLREMSGELKDNVDLMRGVMETLFSDKHTETAPWDGESAKMMKTELDRLFKPASSAPQVLEDNATAMDEFSTKVTDTLIQIDQLHVKSKGHGGDTAGEQADIDKARQIMQTATTDYLTSAEQMPEPEFYGGLRKSAEDGPSDGWTAWHGATPTGDAPPPVPASTTDPQPEPTPAGDPSGQQPGPTWQPPADTEPSQPTEPQLQGPAPAPAPLAPNPVAPPVAGPPAPVTVVPPTPGPLPPPSGRPPVSGPPTGRPVPVTRPSPIPNPLQPRPTNTVPPVIGRPRPNVMPPMQPRPVVPNPTGTVPPVIGTRPGPVVPPVTRPIPPGPNGTVPPVIGTRPGPGTAPIPGRPAAPHPEGTVRPVIGARPGPGVLPYSTRPGPGAVPRPGTGVVPPTGARPGVSGFGIGSANRGKPKPKSGPATGSGAVADTDLVPDRYTNARPAGGLAFGGRSAATPAPPARPVAKPTPGESVTSAKPRPKPVATKPPGQRVKRVPRQGGPAVEHAIVRGAQRKPLSRTPGQEVFAKFDAAAKTAAEEESKPKRAVDPDSEWAIRQVSVPAVITTRKAG